MAQPVTLSSPHSRTTIDLDAPEWQPSVVTIASWVHVLAPGERPRLGGERAFWLVWVSADALDDAWSVVRSSLARGELGWGAKAMTAQQRRGLFLGEGDPPEDERLIVVYCGRDDADATRVRAGLRAAGMRWRMPYKWSFGGKTRRFE